MWALGMNRVDDGKPDGRPAANGANRLTIDHYQSLLSELRTGLAERARAEQELAALETGVDSSSPGNLDSAQRELAAKFESSLALADEQHELARQSLDGQLQTATDAASAGLNRETGEIQRTAAADLDRVEKKFQEDCWL